MYHSNGHFSTEKMLKTIRKFYVWKNMTTSVQEFVKGCKICEKTKVTTNTKIPMGISSTGEMLMDHIFIDFVGPIAESKNGNKYIFTANCDLTKFLVAVPTKDCTALTAAKCILENIICRYNFPSRLISDNATSFTSNVIKELTRLFEIKKIFSTRYHAQSNKVEKAHRFLSSFLKTFTKDRDKWDENLKFATFAYNNTVHSTTGYTPHFLAHSFDIRIPNHLTRVKQTYNYDNLADSTRQNIAEALKLARENIQKRQLENKKYYDRNKSDYEIKENDMVLIKNMNKKHKFDTVYIGPFRVVTAHKTYIEILQDGKRAKYHKNMAKKANSQNFIEINDGKFSQLNNIAFDRYDTMVNTPVQTAQKHVDIEIHFRDVPSHFKHEDMWNWTAKHVEYIKCAHEWKPIVAFCLMWVSTTARMDGENYLIPRPAKWDKHSRIDAGIVLKIRSPYRISNFEIEYDSDKAPFLEDYGFNFKMGISTCLCEKPYFNLIDALKNTIPYELMNKPCSTFLKPYKMFWDKSEDPYILQIEQ